MSAIARWLDRERKVALRSPKFAPFADLSRCDLRLHQAPKFSSFELCYGKNVAPIEDTLY